MHIIIMLMECTQSHTLTVHTTNIHTTDKYTHAVAHTVHIHIYTHYITLHTKLQVHTAHIYTCVLGTVDPQLSEMTVLLRVF